MYLCVLLLVSIHSNGKAADCTGSRLMCYSNNCMFPLASSLVKRTDEIVQTRILASTSPYKHPTYAILSTYENTSGISTNTKSSAGASSLFGASLTGFGAPGESSTSRF